MVKEIWHNVTGNDADVSLKLASLVVCWCHMVVCCRAGTISDFHCMIIILRRVHDDIVIAIFFLNCAFCFIFGKLIRFKIRV